MKIKNSGFTMIEMMLAMTFVAFLMLTIALTTISLSGSSVFLTKALASFTLKVIMDPLTGDVVFSLALIRSPVSGSIMTFKVNEANALVRNTDDPDRGLINNLLTRNFDVCVQNDAGGFMASPLAVRINAGASTGSAVEIPPELEGVCS